MSVDLLQKELVAEYEAIALKKDPELLAIERSLESGRVDADSLDVMRSMGSGLTATKGASGGYFIYRAEVEHQGRCRGIESGL